MRRFALLAISTAVASAAGCQRPPDAPDAPAPPTAAPPSTAPVARTPAAATRTRPATDVDWTAADSVSSADGTYVVDYVFVPETIPLNDVFGVELRVRAADGGAAPPGLALDIDARMPEHKHGMLRVPEIADHGDGRFAVRGMQMHMPGYWEIHFDLTRDGTTERAQVELELD